VSNRRMPDALDLEPFWWLKSPSDRKPGPESDLFLCTHCGTLKARTSFPASAGELARPSMSTTTSALAPSPDD
jgi:hypothetical protein